MVHYFTHRNKSNKYIFFKISYVTTSLFLNYTFFLNNLIFKSCTKQAHRWKFKLSNNRLDKLSSKIDISENSVYIPLWKIQSLLKYDFWLVGSLLERPKNQQIYLQWSSSFKDCRLFEEQRMPIKNAPILN